MINLQKSHRGGPDDHHTWRICLRFKEGDAYEVEIVWLSQRVIYYASRTSWSYLETRTGIAETVPEQAGIYFSDWHFKTALSRHPHEPRRHMMAVQYEILKVST
ncbi:MAG: hypothetical protein OES09_17455 [Gammaproteobacteria bacterium]|nr:hypothetical protein [Gammaproteobacteria bacterium]